MYNNLCYFSEGTLFYQGQLLEINQLRNELVWGQTVGDLGYTVYL